MKYDYQKILELDHKKLIELYLAAKKISPLNLKCIGRPGNEFEQGDCGMVHSSYCEEETKNNKEFYDALEELKKQEEKEIKHFVKIKNFLEKDETEWDIKRENGGFRFIPKQIKKEDKILLSLMHKNFERQMICPICNHEYVSDCCIHSPIEIMDKLKEKK